MPTELEELNKGINTRYQIRFSTDFAPIDRRLLDSPLLAELKPDSELFYYKLQMIVDHWGNHPADTNSIQRALFMARPMPAETDIARWIGDLVQEDLIDIYLTSAEDGHQKVMKMIHVNWHRTSGYKGRPFKPKWPTHPEQPDLMMIRQNRRNRQTRPDKAGQSRQGSDTIEPSTVRDNGNSITVNTTTLNSNDNDSSDYDWGDTSHLPGCERISESSEYTASEVMAILIPFRKFPPTDPVAMEIVLPMIGRHLRAHLQYFTPRECNRMLACLKSWGLLPGPNVDLSRETDPDELRAIESRYPAVDVPALLAEAEAEGIWP